ncbi:MAG: hypothetical protein JSV44_10710 [Candidatus Zixiibacteriota bacterium]|nr:MAG: hypothetical protein JSV44_10710 [candidate division Zixibacteria bacterium]
MAAELPAAVDFWSWTCPFCRVLQGLLRKVGAEYAGRIKIPTIDVIRAIEPVNALMSGVYQRFSSLTKAG